MRHQDNQSAVLVIRAWHEEGSPPGAVRARLTQTREVGATGWDELAVEGEEAILAATREWLQALRSGDGTVTRGL